MKKILCFLGFHKWVKRISGFEPYADLYKECKHCKKRVDIIIAEL